MTADERDGLHDHELAALIRDALEHEETPPAWIERAVAIPRGAAAHAQVAIDLRGARRDLLIPAIASAVLLAGLALTFVLGRESLVHLLPAPGGAAALREATGMSPVRVALAALGILPVAGALALTDAIRGFPLVRHWFA